MIKQELQETSNFNNKKLCIMTDPYKIHSFISYNLEHLGSWLPTVTYDMRNLQSF